MRGPHFFCSYAFNSRKLIHIHKRIHSASLILPNFPSSAHKAIEPSDLSRSWLPSPRLDWKGTSLRKKMFMCPVNKKEAYH